MKILIIGHTYMIDINRDKFYELAKFPDIQIIIATPKRWKTDFYTTECERVRNTNLDVIKLNTIFSGNEPYYFYGFGLLNLIRKIKPDVIHVEQGADAFSYFEAILFSKLFARKSRKVFFTWVNWDARIRFPLTFFEKYNLANTDCALCGNQDAAKILRSKGFEGRIKVLPQLGVDTSMFKKNNADNLRVSLGIDNYCVGYLGRFVKEKGILLLLEACSKIKDKIDILLVGDGPLKRELIESEAKRLNLSSKIIFVPPMMNEKVVPYLNCMDVLVLPSYEINTWKEQFGHVLIEAMTCEVPVIGSSSGEIPNVIGDAGLIFKEKDIQDLKNKIELLMNNRELATELSNKGLALVKSRYTHRMIAEGILKVYEDLML